MADITGLYLTFPRYAQSEQRPIPATAVEGNAGDPASYALHKHYWVHTAISFGSTVLAGAGVVLAYKSMSRSDGPHSIQEVTHALMFLVLSGVACYISKEARRQALTTLALM